MEKKAVIYARLAKESDVDMQIQVIQLKNEAVNKKFEITDVYSEYGSGTLEEIYPEMQRMLNDCIANDIHLVFMRDTSRLSRNIYEFDKRLKLFHKHNVTIWFMQEQLSSQEVDMSLYRHLCGEQ